MTEDGEIAIDDLHLPNGKQGTIGGLFRKWVAYGWIVSTGETVKSRSKHRRSGRILVWTSTEKGRKWAFGLYQALSLYESEHR